MGEPSAARSRAWWRAAEVSSWPFADAVFSWDYDFFADGGKARRFGFHEYVETAAMFPRLFGELRSRRVIP